ncbi:unnamed protein product [Cyclocybe aegerita]|uniref:Major facilitator superfamily (MFS) profile domain-containing protein n=1 Tax=Cyclocybe aegerita TaxID=1973307 RepID=A0A8S0W0M9_CYCAE|nr:unnamed protein product [Cyclocybe aegerita]
MASFQEKGSSTGSQEKVLARVDAAYVLDERRRAALAEVDNANWFHAKPFLYRKLNGFFNSYNIFAINITSMMLGYVYGPDYAGLNKQQDLGVKVATPVGTLVGWQICSADGIELLIIIVVTFAQALSGNAAAIHIVGVLIVWCFIPQRMGIGIGGDYPLSAVISSEFTSTKICGCMMTAVFALQGWGNFTAALVAFIITATYKSAILSALSVAELEAVDFMWHLLIGLGCVPGVIALYFCLTIPETPRFTMDIEHNIDHASADIKNVLTNQRNRLDEDAPVQCIEAPKASWNNFTTYFGQWKNFKIIFGTSYSWFALDIAFYGLGLNSAIILQAIGFGKPSTTGVRGVYDNLNNICISNLILLAAGLIPGYWVSFLFIDSWGHKPIQLMGFIMLTILFVILGFGYDRLISPAAATKAFVFLYCLANFFQNFGPNVTTFIIPREIFPICYRSTAHGISAASGKLGAIVAQVGFSQLKDIGGPNKFVTHM